MGNMAFLHGNGGGAVKVETSSGTVKTSSNGTATIDNCGWRPDAVFFTRNETYSYGETTYTYATAAVFSPISKNVTNCCIWTNSSSYELYDMYVTRTDTGFSMVVYGVDEALDGTKTGVSFNYTAIKYTE